MGMWYLCMQVMERFVQDGVKANNSSKLNWVDRHHSAAWLRAGLSSSPWEGVLQDPVADMISLAVHHSQVWGTQGSLLPVAVLELSRGIWGFLGMIQEFICITCLRQKV